MSRRALALTLPMLALLGFIALPSARSDIPRKGSKPGPIGKAVVDAIKPLPLTPIPDDPPPHEGAMIDIPYIIEPPDIILVEVLEALPARPISGERLVRPDGTIDLGFYGNVHVRGLTERQAKTKIVEHLRMTLPDEILGLEEVDPFQPEEPAENLPLPQPNPNLPKIPAEKPEVPGVKKKPASFKTIKTAQIVAKQPAAPREPVKNKAPLVEPQVDAQDHSKPLILKLPAGGNMRITIEIQSDVNPKPSPEFFPPPPQTGPLKINYINAEDSNRVFVDVTAYNSKHYYVYGDVAAPGKMPFTGKDTVLDALNYCGGLVTTANPKEIKLYRPARGGKPLKVYPIDLDAIQNGDTSKNFQIFPGDRISVGRTAATDVGSHSGRLEFLMRNQIYSLTRLSEMTTAFNQATEKLPAAKAKELANDWFDLWWKTVSKEGGPLPDPAATRELFLKLLLSVKDAEKK